MLNFPNGLLIRKYVGNDKVEYINTRTHRLLSHLSRRVLFQQSFMRCNTIVTAFGYNRLFALCQFLYQYQG